MAQTAPNPTLRFWKTSSVVMAIAFVLLLAYTVVYNGNVSWLAVSQAIAGTAAILIGSSFAMSGLAFFFDFLDDKIVLRKYLGLLGFWLALIYSLMLPFLQPELYWSGLLNRLGTADVLLGGWAMAILALMTLISNRRGMLIVGAKNFRPILRMGYAAYAMLIIRGYVIEKNSWLDWLQDMANSLPPPRLVISIFAILVIILRIAVSVVKWGRTYHTASPAGQSPTT